jgi:hypothetical protein
MLFLRKYFMQFIIFFKNHFRVHITTHLDTLSKTRSSNAPPTQMEIHPFRLQMETAEDAVTRKSKLLESTGSLEVGLMIQHSQSHQDADREVQEQAAAVRIATASSYGGGGGGSLRRGR